MREKAISDLSTDELWKGYAENKSVDYKNELGTAICAAR